MRKRAAALIVATIAINGLQVVQAQTIDGTWMGTAAVKPDSGLPVSLRLKIERSRDSLRVKLSLLESGLIDLELPSPYSDSSYASYTNRHLHAEFTPDIGLGIIGFPREHIRQWHFSRRAGDVSDGSVDEG